VSFNKISFLQDRFTQGTIAGIFGAIPQSIFNLSLTAIHISNFSLLRFAGVLAFNHIPNGLLEKVLAKIIVFIMQAALGGLFAWWLKEIECDTILWKGFFFGGTAWFTIVSVATVFRLPGIYPIGTTTGIIIMLGSAIYGVAMAWGLLILNRKFGVKN